jgi:hypothetical protein
MGISGIKPLVVSVRSKMKCAFHFACSLDDKKAPLRVLFYLVREGFEPSKASPTDLQSVPFGRSGTSPFCFLSW